MDHEQSNGFFYKTKQDGLAGKVVACLELNHRPPEELTEYLYRKEFGYTHREFDQIPSKRYNTDLLIMNLIGEWQERSK